MTSSEEFIFKEIWDKKWFAFALNDKSTNIGKGDLVLSVFFLF